MPKGPRAIDPVSGFEVPHSELVRQWNGEWVYRRYADKRNPQDFVRGRAERFVLPHPRPEPPEVFLAFNLLWEDSVTPIITEDGDAVLSEGRVVAL